jgi:hypothetical protein
MIKRFFSNIMKTIAIPFVLSAFVLALTGQASAAIVRYKSSGDWFDTTTNTGDVNGWRAEATGPGGLPGTADHARINWANNTVTLAGDAGTIARLYLGVDEPGNLVINPGGVLTASARSGIGDGAATAGTLTINGGELLIGSERWDMGVNNNAHTATVTINSGLMRVHAPYNQNKITTTATTTLNGGVLRVNSLNLTTGVMDIAGGALRIVNVTEATIAGWIADGLMRFFGKTGGVKDMDYTLTTFQNGFEITAIPARSTFQLTITPNGGNYDFSWESQPGKAYDLLTSLDLATPVAEWPVYDALYEGIPSAGETTTLTAVPSADPRRFFAMREFDAPPPPPLFAWDFEDDNGGFTTIGTPNDWDWGTPNSDSGAGLILTAGTGGSAKCWATKLGAGGNPSGLINPNADSILRSPDIDLTGITSAQLSFAAAYDAAVGDVIEIVIKNAATGVPIGDPIRPVNTTSATFSNWIILGPFDLSAADHAMIYLEFRYNGTDDKYIGLYIDDVKISR